MDRNEVESQLQRKRALEGFNNGGNYLSNTPYYIQNLERKVDMLEYKINLLLEKLHGIDDK